MAMRYLTVGQCRLYRLGLALATLASVLLPGVAAAQVRWEDYRGTQRVASDSNYIGPAGKPRFVNYPNGGAMAPFRALTADPSNAVRTGTSANINFRQGATDTLCDNTGGVTSQACLYQAQGRIAYALIQFPQAGSYTLSAAHDDNLVVELSNQYSNTDYRNAVYGIPVGALAAWTLNENTYETIGTFSAANVNSCALIRVYWTNQEGINHNRLRWTTPAGTTEIIPSSAFRDPALVTSSVGCNGSVDGNGTSITLNKVIGSPRLNSSDQFTVEIGTTTAAGTVRSATTAGSGTGQQASTGAYPAATGIRYYLRDVMASGSVSTIGAYTATIACTRNGVAFTPTSTGSTTAPGWSVTPAANDKIACTITNAAANAPPTVTVRKVSLGGVGTFDFSGSNGIGSHAITTTTAGAPATGTTYTLTNAAAATTITEAAPSAGFQLTAATCTGMGTGGTATPDLVNRTVTLDAAATAAGNAIVCTFTNTAQADLSLTKTVTPTSAAVGQTVTYTLTAANAGPAAADGATITDPAVTGLNCAGATPTCSSSGGASCPSPLTAAQLQGSGAVVPVFPVGGQVVIGLQCTVTGTP